VRSQERNNWLTGVRVNLNRTSTSFLVFTSHLSLRVVLGITITSSVSNTAAFAITGNDPELDPNREPEPPTRAVDRPVPRHGKRDAPKEPALQPNLSENNSRRGGRFSGNEAGMCSFLYNEHGGPNLLNAVHQLDGECRLIPIS
jgi:hypothetical protein